MSNLVANPLYGALQNLYQQLQNDAPTLSNPLQAADRQMAAGKTWVGPTGQGWGDQLHGYSTDCASQVTELLSEISQLMQNTPQQVTPQQAQSISQSFGKTVYA